MSNARNRTGCQKVSNYREPSDGARRYSFSVNMASPPFTQSVRVYLISISRASLSSTFTLYRFPCSNISARLLKVYSAVFLLANACRSASHIPYVTSKVKLSDEKKNQIQEFLFTFIS